MNKEIKYCLSGAIITFIISAIMTYFEVLPAITLFVKIVYIGFTIGLVYFLIRLLTTAEVSKDSN